jgi:hypothetical protein
VRAALPGNAADNDADNDKGTTRHMRLHALSIGAACGICALPAFAATVLTVGPGRQYHTISAAVAAADRDPKLADTYVIEVVPGTYTNDFPLVRRPMTIEVDPAHARQRVVLQATGLLLNGKGIILTTASLTVNGLTFSGARIDNSVGGNGAGIRDENTGPARLIVRNSTFIGNQEGILDDGDPAETVTIANSAFKNNGNPASGSEHGIYIGRSGKLTVSNSLFCGQVNGNALKSRARVTTVENSIIYTGQANPRLGCGTGAASYDIDLSNGGVATISKNQIIKGNAAPNHIMIAYGTEGLVYGDNRLLVSGNNFISTATSFSPTAIFAPPCSSAGVSITLAHNTFKKVSTIVYPSDCTVSQK